MNVRYKLVGWLGLSNNIIAIKSSPTKTFWKLITYFYCPYHVIIAWNLNIFSQLLAKRWEDYTKSYVFPQPTLVDRPYVITFITIDTKAGSKWTNLMRGTLETKRKSNDYLICCKEWCAGAWIVKWTGSWSNLDKWQLCTCRWGNLLLLGIQQPKQNIPGYLAISLEDIIHNTLIWSFLNKMRNIVYDYSLIIVQIRTFSCEAIFIVF